MDSKKCVCIIVYFGPFEVIFEMPKLDPLIAVFADFDSRKQQTRKISILSQ